MGLEGFEDPRAAARLLTADADVVVVTDSSHGSYIGHSKGEVIKIPRVDTTVIDLCGAGDAYAAGFFVGLRYFGPQWDVVGRLASEVASKVIAR